MTTSTTTLASPAAALLDEWEVGTADFRLVAVDLYRDIHKGIRAELFALVERAGGADPNDRNDRLALADHVLATHVLLESHAHHEDAAIQPVLERELPALAERIERDHHELDARIARIADMAASLDDARRGSRCATHLLYLDLARFTSEYLVHIDIEERVLMPALERAVGAAAVLDLHAAIVGSIPPDDMARSLSLMLPAMNIEDRCELLGGMRAGAPAEVFAGVLDLARSVIRPDEYATLTHRLGAS